jgi:hypothetical protein
MKAVAENWHVKTIVPMHFGLGEAGWMKPYGGNEGLRNKVLAQWPNTLRLDTEMDCKKVNE